MCFITSLLIWVLHHILNKYKEMHKSVEGLHLLFKNPFIVLFNDLFDFACLSKKTYPWITLIYKIRFCVRICQIQNSMWMQEQNQCHSNRYCFWISWKIITNVLLCRLFKSFYRKSERVDFRHIISKSSSVACPLFQWFNSTPRTHRINKLKSQILKPTFLS